MRNNIEQPTQTWLTPDFERSARTQLDELRKRLSELETERRATLKNIKALKELVNDDSPMPELDSMADDQEIDGAYNDILTIAARVLDDEHPEDMSYQDLAREVRARGGALSANDSTAYSTLVRMMNEDSRRRFFRPNRRGRYALRRHYPPGTPNVGERRQSGAS